MGYTIYIDLSAKEVKKRNEANAMAWEETCNKIRKAWKKIPKTYKDDYDVSYEFVGVGDGLGKGEPVINKDYICFNGKGKDSCESFYFGAYEKVEDLDSFCKTERNGYTMAVMVAILCIKKFYNNALTYSSGGGDKKVWAMAEEIVSKL